MEDLKKLFELGQERNALRYAWLRNILTIAVGSLALLVSFRPDTPLPAPQNYFLVAAWVFLGLGIIFGAIATYGEVAMAATLVKLFHKKLMENHAETDRFELSGPVVANPHWIYKISAPLMCWSLLVAVVALVIYASLDTLKF